MGSSHWEGLPGSGSPLSPHTPRTCRSGEPGDLAGQRPCPHLLFGASLPGPFLCSGWGPLYGVPRRWFSGLAPASTLSGSRPWIRRGHLAAGASKSGPLGHAATGELQADPTKAYQVLTVTLASCRASKGTVALGFLAPWFPPLPSCGSSPREQDHLCPPGQAITWNPGSP